MPASLRPAPPACSPARRRARPSLGLGSVLLAYALQPIPLPGVGLAMLAGGLAGGVVQQEDALAWVLRPATGFALGISASLLRYALASGFSALFRLNRPPLSLGIEALTALINGAGVALILQVVAQIRARAGIGAGGGDGRGPGPPGEDEPAFPLQRPEHHRRPVRQLTRGQFRVRTSRFARFLRGSLERARPGSPSPCERNWRSSPPTSTWSRCGWAAASRSSNTSRPASLKAQIPPFLVQPLVENAVMHGIQPRDEGGWVRLEGARGGEVAPYHGRGHRRRPPAPGLDGLPGSGPCDRTHALDLLRLRLAKLYDGSFSLEVRGEPGRGDDGRDPHPPRGLRAAGREGGALIPVIRRRGCGG